MTELAEKQLAAWIEKETGSDHLGHVMQMTGMYGMVDDGIALHVVPALHAARCLFVFQVLGGGTWVIRAEVQPDGSVLFMGENGRPAKWALADLIARCKRRPS